MFVFVPREFKRRQNWKNIEEKRRKARSIHPHFL